MKILFRHIANTKIFEDLIDLVFSTCAKQLSLPNELSVSVSFVSPIRIKALNLSMRGMDRVTDVLSFPLFNLKPGEPILYEESDVDPETKTVLLGDIVICRKRALEQAKQYEHSERREIAFLAIHGLLHLLGYDHIDEVDRLQMRAMEEQILQQISLSRDMIELGEKGEKSI